MESNKSLNFTGTAFSVIYRRHSRRRLSSFAAAHGPIPMGKRKPPKRATPPKLPAGEKVLASSSSESPACTGSTDSLQVSIEAPTSQRTASVSNFQDPISVPVTGSEDPNTVITVNSAKVILVTDPAKTPTCEDKEEGEISPTKSNLITEKDDAILDKTRNFVLASVPTTDNTATAKSAPPAVEEVYIPVDPKRHSTASLKESASSFKKMEIGETSGKVESSARGSIDRASLDLGGLEMSAAESDSSDLDSSDSHFLGGPSSLSLFDPQDINASKSQRALRNIAVQAIIYNIWAERNDRIFNNKALTPLERFNLVDKNVRNIISARKTRKEFKHLMVL
ncbi:hypothetical protein IGI04_010545, partial [Brassica rapa subsp. trilocularis]